MSVSDEWPYPNILRQPIRDRKRYNGSIIVSGEVRATDDPEILAQINERWAALTSHFSLDPKAPDIWQALACALSNFDYSGFSAAEADWARLAAKLVHQKFPGFRIDPPPDNRKWTLARYKVLVRIVDTERKRSPHGARIKPKSVIQATRDLFKSSRNGWLKSKFKNAEALRNEYYRARRAVQDEARQSSLKAALGNLASRPNA